MHNHPPKKNATSTTWGIHDYDYTNRSKQLHLWRQDLLKIYCPSSWTIMDSCPMIPTIFRFTVLRSLRLRSLAIQTWGSNRPEKNVAIVEFCDCFGVAFWLGMFWGKGSSSIPWYTPLGDEPGPCRVSPASQLESVKGFQKTSNNGWTLHFWLRIDYGKPHDSPSPPLSWGGGP